jgi:hypothetical protein
MNKLMLSRYYGQELIRNDKFWDDVAIQYKGERITLPITYDPFNIRKLQMMLECPSGCDSCCRYDKLHVTDDEIKTIGTGIEVKCDGNLKYIPCRNGCPFLKDNHCSIYGHRPNICWLYPIQSFQEIDSEKLITYRVFCPSSVKVIRKVFNELKGSILLPDLTWVKRNL